MCGPRIISKAPMWPEVENLPSSSILQNILYIPCSECVSLPCHHAKISSGVYVSRDLPENFLKILTITKNDL